MLGQGAERLAGVGEDRKVGSSGIIMAIVGGAVLGTRLAIFLSSPSKLVIEYSHECDNFVVLIDITNVL